MTDTALPFTHGSLWRCHGNPGFERCVCVCGGAEVFGVVSGRGHQAWRAIKELCPLGLIQVLPLING